MFHSSPSRDPSLQGSLDVRPRRFTLHDLELVAALAAIWIGAFALNWWHVVP